MRNQASTATEPLPPATEALGNGPLKIDLGSIIRKRLGKRGKMVPGALLHGLENLVCQERLNELLEACWPATGSDFSEALFEELDINVEENGLENLPEGEQFLFASNHPLGGLDGIALVGVLGKKYGDSEIRVVVNDMLMNVEPLREVFLPVNKYGAQGRENASRMAAAFAGGKQIVMFPAGLVSRLGNDGKIADLEWKKSFVVQALRHNLRIVPVRFEGLNTKRFYKTAQWRKRLHIPVNIEQALLPSELCRASGSTFTVTFLPPVNTPLLRSQGVSPSRIAAHIRSLTNPD